MVKTGIKEYDELPPSTWRTDIDALRACYVKNDKPGFIERFWRKLGFKGIAIGYTWKRDKNQYRAKKELDKLVNTFKAVK